MEQRVLAGRGRSLGKEGQVKVIWKFAACVAMLAICASGSLVAVGQELAGDQYLRIAVDTSDMGGMDPHKGQANQDMPVHDAVWEKLVTFAYTGDPTSDVVPELAESWEVSDDGLLYTFHLRQGVKWHRGHGEVTAEDVKFSFDRVRDPVRSIISNTLPWKGIEEVAVVDTYTVTITLKYANAEFLRYLAFPGAIGPQILCKRVTEESNDVIKTDLVGTGPWMWAEYIPQERITLVKNPDYWRGEPTIERIDVLYMQSPEARSMALLSGDIDIAKGPSDQAWVEQMQAAGFIVDQMGPSVSSVVQFNMSHPPLDNWLVRAALAHVIDREEIAAAMGKSVAFPQLSPVPEDWLYGIPGYEGVPTFVPNVELAKQLLAAAGYPNGFSLHSYVSERTLYKVQFEVMQAQLKRIGVDFQLTIVDHTTYRTNVFGDMNDIAMLANTGWNAEAHFAAFWDSDSIPGKPTGYINFAHYGDIGGSVDDLLDLAKGASEEVKRVLFEAAQIRIVVDMGGWCTVTTKTVQARQPYVDLGYVPISSTTGGSYNIPWNARLLAH
jgi:peptide/nickel transport system substrate-binding protein